MIMNKEQYVTFEVAKLLKEKGFDWECRAYWHEDDKVLIESQSPCYLRNITNPCWFGNTAPTQQMVCDWLIKEKNIYVTSVPDIGNSLRFYPAIYVIKGKTPEEYWFEHINSVVKEINMSYDKPQQAVEEAFLYILKNMI